jgi:predicted RND superfamily exporter protein
MAVSISFGLGFATLLVLFLVPVMLSYIEQLAEFIASKNRVDLVPEKVKVS